MKKILAMLLVFVLLCGVCAFAEEGLDIPKPESKRPEVSKKDEDSLAVTTLDLVTVNDGITGVSAEGINIFYAQDSMLPYLVFTQDMRASFDNYYMLNSPDAFQSQLIQEGIHMFWLSMQTNACAILRVAGICGLDNFSLIDDSLIDLYAVRLLDDWGVTGGSVDILTTTAGMKWMRIDSWLYLTCVNGRIVVINTYGDNDTLTQDEILDFEDIIANLIII